MEVDFLPSELGKKAVQPQDSSKRTDKQAKTDAINDMMIFSKVQKNR